MLEEFANRRQAAVEHDGEQFTGISSGSETLPCHQDLKVTRSLSKVLDLVDGVPDAIRQLCNFLHLRWSPNRTVFIRPDAADVHDSSFAGKQGLNLHSEVRQDAGDTARSDPIGARSVRPSDNDVVSNGRLVGDHMRLSVVTLNSQLPQTRERLVDILVHLVQGLQKFICAH